MIRGVHPGLVPAHPISTSDTKVRFSLNKVRILGVAGGKIAWEINAENFDTEKNSPVTRMTGLKHVAIRDGNTEALTVSAGELEQNSQSHSVTVRDNVTVTGKNLVLHTPLLQWWGDTDVLQLPQPIAAQIGDYTLTTRGATLYGVRNGVVRSDGGVVLSAKGNTLSAKNIVLDTNTKAFEVDGPVTMLLDVADLQGWTGGRPLPKIPEIPDSIKKRYAAYRREHGLNTPTPPVILPKPGAHAKGTVRP